MAKSQVAPSLAGESMLTLEQLYMLASEVKGLYKFLINNCYKLNKFIKIIRKFIIVKKKIIIHKSNMPPKKILVFFNFSTFSYDVIEVSVMKKYTNGQIYDKIHYYYTAIIFCT